MNQSEKSEPELVFQAKAEIYDSLRKLKSKAERTVEKGEEILDGYDKTDLPYIDKQAVKNRIRKNEILAEMLEEKTQEAWEEKKQAQKEYRDNN